MAGTILVEVTDLGGNIVIDGSAFNTETVILQIYSQAGVVLSNDFHLEINPNPADGTIVQYILSLNTPFDLNGNTFDIDSVFFTQSMLDSSGIYNGIKYYSNFGGGTFWYSSFLTGGFLDGSQLLDNSVALAKLVTGSSGKIIVCDGSGIPAYVSMSGDISITNTGVTAIGSGVIVNADVNASAAIARTKLASGSVNHVLINDGSGIMSSEAALAKSRGGFGTDVSAATGFVKFSSGTLDISAITEVITIPVSFESGEQCQNKIKLPYAGTVTEIYAISTKAISGTDDATITAKNGAGTTMSSGTITFTAGDPIDTAYSVSPLANNTFSAGDTLQFVTAKVTAGGKALVSIKITRLS